MNKKSIKWKSVGKKKSFMKIWLASLLPLLLLTILVGISVLGMVLTAIVNIRRLTATENAMQLADILGAQLAEGEPVERERELLHLQRYDMVAAVYNEEDEEIMCSDIGKYAHSDVISVQIYEEMLDVIETEGVYGERAYQTQGVDAFGHNFWYDETMIYTETGNYVLRYASVAAPYLERKSDFQAMGFLTVLFMIFFSLLPAGYYYSIYRERIKMEEYYRNTSNGLAHDLKTPLMAVSGYAENLRENAHTEKREYYVDAILRNVSHMDVMVENMLEMSRLENQKVLLRREDVELRELTEEDSIDRLKEEIRAKELTVGIQGTYTISADRALMQRALDNLIGNAVKHTPEKQSIAIRMGDGQYQITNTGVSLDKAQLKELWKPFVKGNHTAGNVSGTGIGLTIVKEIMERHALRCQISSDRDCFSVIIRTRRRWA